MTRPPTRAAHTKGGTLMAHRQTEKALGRRAMRTAIWLEAWSKKIQQEVKNQDIDLWGQPSMEDRWPNAQPNLWSVSPCYFVRDLVIQMHERIGEIRTFADPTI